MTVPKMMLVLSENWSLTSHRDLSTMVRWAREAEDAGFDAVGLSDHVVIGPDASVNGRMSNPREYVMPGNQDPYTPWPDVSVLFGAIAATTSRIRLAAAALVAPLRHPLALAKELATLDLLSAGRLVVLPTVSWSRDEYAALGVPFRRRGELLDEHLAIWSQVWQDSPCDFDGKHYRFQDVYFEPKPFRPGGPVLWFGGSFGHDRAMERLVRYGHGVFPLHWPEPALAGTLEQAMAEAGRDAADLEVVAALPATFPDAHSLADLDRTLAAIPDLMAAGVTTFVLKPSQFTDDPNRVGKLCDTVVRRVAGMLAA